MSSMDVSGTPSYSALETAKSVYQATPNATNALAYVKAFNKCLKEANIGFRIPLPSAG